MYRFLTSGLLVFLIPGFSASEPIPRDNAASARTDTIPGIRKVCDVVIYEDARFHCAFPSVVKREGGEVIVAFRRAPTGVKGRWRVVIAASFYYFFHFRDGSSNHQNTLNN